MYLGCHLSISKGLLDAAKTARSIDANTFQFFTRNPRGGKAKDYSQGELDEFQKYLRENKFGPLQAHAAYTMNLASDKAHVRSFAKEILLDDMDRLLELPKETVYVFHPGSHVGQGVEEAKELIIEALKEAVTHNPINPITLEGMSGKGTEVGQDLQDLADIIEAVDAKNLGVTLDTCHLYSAGYDVKDNLDQVIETIDKTVGLARVKSIHLNDSLTELNSKKDRHALIGQGTIGLNALYKFITYPAFDSLPINLETPNDPEGHKKEIIQIKEKNNEIISKNT